MLIVSLEYTPESRRSYCAESYSVYDNHTTLKLKRVRIRNMQFAVYMSGTPVTVKENQGHQRQNGNVDPDKCYNHAQFERPCLDDV